MLGPWRGRERERAGWGGTEGEQHLHQVGCGSLLGFPDAGPLEGEGERERGIGSEAQRVSSARRPQRLYHTGAKPSREVRWGLHSFSVTGT